MDVYLVMIEKGDAMSKIEKNFFYNLLFDETPFWSERRAHPAAQTQCFAAIVVLLADIADHLKDIESAILDK